MQRLNREIMSRRKGHDERTQIYGETQEKTQERAHGWKDTGKDSEKGARMGSHGNRRINSNGEHLLDTLRGNNMIITNTFSPHKLTHRTTSTSPDEDNSNYFDGTTRRNPWRNQIDYITKKIFHKCIVKNSGSYEGITSVTNNKLVKMEMSFEWWKLTRKSSTETTSMTQLYGKNTKRMF